MKFYRPLGDRECTGDFFVCQTAHHLTVIGCWRNLSAQFDRDSAQRGRPVVSTKNRALIDECRVPQISTAVTELPQVRSAFAFRAIQPIPNKIGEVSFRPRS